MASIIKADNIQKVSDGSNIIKKCGSTITLGSCGATISLAAGATQTGFGQTYSATAYCTTVKAAPFTAVAGKGYFVNTTCGAITVTLPATPTVGDTVSIKDYAYSFATNNVTICSGCKQIGGGGLPISSPLVYSTNGIAKTFIYADDTKGWLVINETDTSKASANAYITATGGTVVTCGDYKTHIFTSDGTFCVSAGTGPFSVVDYFVVAGGGGGAGSPDLGAGGGGAGGFRVSNSYNLPAPSMSPLASCASTPITPGAYPVTVGGGGTGGCQAAPVRYGTSGSNSIFNSITSAGGGAAKGIGAVPACQSLFDGGSGGGGASRNSPSPYIPLGASGNTPPVNPPQGNNGGNAFIFVGHPSSAGGGGGGGAGAVGGTASPNPGPGGPGGAGSFIADGFVSPTCAPTYGTPGPTPAVRYFAGGGGGGTYATGCGGTGGTGGGGRGSTGTNPASPALAGTANTGGGGGGGGYGCTSPNAPACGQAGGSGIVMIRYKFQ